MTNPNKTDKILIIDNNMLRFHHYDLMESMLYYKPTFLRLKKEYQQYLHMSHYDQMCFLMNTNRERNILNFFSNPTDFTLVDYSKMLNELIDYSGKITRAELYYTLSMISNRKMTEIILYQFSSDLVYDKDVIGENTVVIRDENILDEEKVIEIITTKEINCVFCDSIDFAIEISPTLKNVLFIIPDYGYNMEDYPTGKYLKHLKEIVEYSKNGNEYTLFNNLKIRKDE